MPQRGVLPPTVNAAPPRPEAPSVPLAALPVGLGGRVRRVYRRWRDRRRLRAPTGRLRPARAGFTRGLGWVLGLCAAALIVGAGVLVWRALVPGEPAVPAPLSDADARAYDVVAAQAEDHIERGSALLEIGLPEPALREFGAAVNTLEFTPLRTNPWVRPRIDALEAGIAAIYRERRVAVPTRFARAAPRTPSAAPLAREARLSPAEFTARLESVRSAFAGRFGHPLVVTGRDHAEHVALYGPGGATDLRVRDLPRDQVQFVVVQLRAAGIRVKDFSTDAVLQAQVAAANAAGLADRASTGLHLHADRFVDRVDRWTVH